MTKESDILRWFAMAEDGDKKPEKVEKRRWRMAFRNWLGKPREGNWVREPVATNVVRTFATNKIDKDGNAIMYEETVYANDGYRPKMDDEKATRKAFYHRGARIWRN